MRGKQRHDQYLDDLVYHLGKIDQDRRAIRWIMKDGVWLQDGINSQRKLCDLIIIYDTYGVPVELKGSRNKRAKAIEQIQSGADFIRSELGMTTNYGVFVVYGSKGYEYENLDVPIRHTH